MHTLNISWSFVGNFFAFKRLKICICWWKQLYEKYICYMLWFLKMNLGLMHSCIHIKDLTNQKELNLASTPFSHVNIDSSTSTCNLQIWIELLNVRIFNLKIHLFIRIVHCQKLNTGTQFCNSNTKGIMKCTVTVLLI